MENASKRRLARAIIGGRAEFVLRAVYAARYAARFDAPGRRTKDRFELYDLISSEVIRGTSFDYLEFGVFQGESIRHISSCNKHPDARFWGFDSFEGLPSDWNQKNPKGTFDVGGQPPSIDDRRVRFVKGWFDQSLPMFLRDYRPQEKLWIHVDGDLYSSAMQVLTLLNPYIRSGTVLIFDEIEDLLHEFKALCDYEAMSAKRLDLFAATEDCRQAAFVSSLGTIGAK
ncbi:MAG TPA: TylF/MycF/NovP-related O-methyltransferase [Stellaceae bacterium]|nr:TylF/MycF/NovP-related O-methyltransferase [Stellaceae bacterium]